MADRATLCGEAEDRDGIAAEPPIDLDGWATGLRLDGTLVAIAVDELVGSLHVEQRVWAVNGASGLSADETSELVIERVALGIPAV